MREIKWQKYMLEDEEEHFDEDDEDSVFDKMQKIQKQQFTPKIVSFLGKFPEDFNMWVGHTNFNLTPDICMKIGNTEGVEIFKVFSPYRFLISVGMAFDSSIVKNSIQNILNIETYKNNDFDKYTTLFTQLVEKNPNDYLIMYVAPNGNYDYKLGMNIDELLKYEELYLEAKHKVGGEIYKSWMVKGV